MDELAAFLPSSAGDTEQLLGRVQIEKVVGWGEVVAEGWSSTWLSDIVNVEIWVEWVSKDDLSEDLAVLEGDKPSSSLDDSLATLEGSLQKVVLSGANQVVLVSKGVVCWVLEVRVDETISDGHTLEVNL